MPGVVPESNHRIEWIVVLVTQSGERGRGQQEQSAFRSLQPQPTGAEHAQEMATGEQNRIAIEASQAGNHSVRASLDLCDAFTARATVAEQLPVGPLVMDLLAGESFVVAVVPFNQVGVDLRLRPEPRQFASRSCAEQGAGEDPGDREIGHPLPETAGVPLAARGERQVGFAGVLPRQAPLGLAMAS